MGFGLGVLRRRGASGLLVGFAARGVRRVGDSGVSTGEHCSRASFASRAAGLAFGVAATAGAVGTALTANALVMMRVDSRRNSSGSRSRRRRKGIAAPRGGVFNRRGGGARDADAKGEPTLEVRAVNAVGAYKTQDDMLYR